MAAVSVGAVFILGGCLGSGDAQDARDSAFMISLDGGATFAPRVQTVDGESIAAVQVVALAQSRANPTKLYIGTLKSGIFASDDRGETWRRLAFEPTKVYGIVTDPQDENVLYASGVYDGAARLYKTTDGGATWEQLYTEPLQKRVITALAMDPSDARVLYIGLSTGAIMQTRDGGASWRAIHKARAPVVQIAFDANDPKTVYFGLYRTGILKTRDGGATVIDFTDRLSGKAQKLKRRRSTRVYALATDPRNGGVVYVGTDDGVYRSADYAQTWEALPVIGLEAKKVPVRAIAVNPHNPQQIVYTVARTIYRNSGGDFAQWTPVPFSASRVAGAIWYDREESDTLYIGTRSIKK